MVDGFVRRHSARCPQARMYPIWKRQGPRERLEPARSHPGPSRADLHTASRNWSPNIRRCRTPSSSACPMSASMSRKPRSKSGIAKEFPLILSSGRLVEYEGGGEETRSNKWLAELQQDMFIEINPADAAERGIKDGGWVWVTGAENSAKASMKALVTERVGKGVTWCRSTSAAGSRASISARTTRRAPIRSCLARASTRSRPMAMTRLPACKSRKPPSAKSERRKEQRPWRV